MLKTKLTAALFVFTLFGIFAESCQGQFLMNWLRGRNVNPRVYRYNSFYRGPAAAPVNAQLPGTCVTTCPKVCYQTVNRVVANYVPYTAYRTEWYRVPVTHYRPMTSHNPQTGCTSTCMRPCVTYRMQARRVPYTTYQTVYRTVQHRVPYMTYETSYGTGGCSTGNCGTPGVASGCSSCGTAPAAPTPTMYGSVTQPTVQSPVVQSPAGTSYPTTSYPSNYGLDTNSNYSSGADTVPRIDGQIQSDTTLQKPANSEPPSPSPDENPDGGTSNSSHQSTPVINPPTINAPGNSNNKTAELIRRKWNYSPVRTAAFAASDTRSQPRTKSAFSKPSSNNAFRSVSSGWKSSN